MAENRQEFQRELEDIEAKVIELFAMVAEDLPGPGSVFLQLDLRFLAPVRPDDVITGTVQVTVARRDKPIIELRVRVTRDDGVVAVEGSAVCWLLNC